MTLPEAIDYLLDQHKLPYTFISVDFDSILRHSSFKSPMYQSFPTESVINVVLHRFGITYYDLLLVMYGGRNQRKQVVEKVRLKVIEHNKQKAKALRLKREAELLSKQIGK